MSPNIPLTYSIDAGRRTNIQFEQVMSYLFSLYLNPFSSVFGRWPRICTSSDSIRNNIISFNLASKHRPETPSHTTRQDTSFLTYSPPLDYLFFRQFWAFAKVGIERQLRLRDIHPNLEKKRSVLARHSRLNTGCRAKGAVIRHSLPIGDTGVKGQTERSRFFLRSPWFFS